ncbi:hypothetical protein G6F16_012662 [Rhizopus arrhizus]|nr:hypothetical protein G6F19_012440 [Rhizopus arrhizus]KAG0822403.1 hypothetical protein G6F18_011784 [Rhizopus arrhizus]KAG0847109.1 hypothetical protein G6F17_012827 [Rhizopus arrhizus]KAG0862261.1 hypothetical protein G6F16_012662 [Rhizopus arrhizus]KAG0890418.1 hypothetical protein G6F34_012552 [Rhizopus arrhizus]
MAPNKTAITALPEHNFNIPSNMNFEITMLPQVATHTTEKSTEKFSLSVEPTVTPKSVPMFCNFVFPCHWCYCCLHKIRHVVPHLKATSLGQETVQAIVKNYEIVFEGTPLLLLMYA